MEFLSIIHLAVSVSDAAFRVTLSLAVLALAALLLWQLRTSKSLSAELRQLEKLQKSNVEYEFVLKAMRLCTWHIDPQTRAVTYDYDFRNEEGGWAPTDVGRQLNSSGRQLAKEDALRVNKAVNDICAGRIEEYHEVYRVLVPLTGKTYWEESFAIVTKRDADGRPLSIVGTSMCVDERKAMEAALVAARNKAEESNRLKSAFIANMSHEIRTPLNAIIGFTSVLPGIDDPGERRQLINLIQDNNEKLLRIINDVLDISKIEAGSVQLEMTTFDVCALIREAVNIHKPSLQPGVTIATDFCREPMLITTDRGSVFHVLDRLLSNAVKFTKKGTVTVGFDEPQGGRFDLWVKDTGKGIAPDQQEHIFERFYKVDEFVPGAGLGLSLCRTVAFALGGTIRVESQPGAGSTFWLVIPI